MEPTAELRDYQDEASDSVINYFYKNDGNPVVAMPTGTGKSLVIGGVIKKSCIQWPATRHLVLTHVKELVEQNAKKLQALWPNAPMGIYSAGLEQYDTAPPIVFGGVASVANCVEKFGHRDLLHIDEAQLVDPDDDRRYSKVISALKKVNPYMKTVGYTATDYRLGMGRITDEGGHFTDVCCDMTGVEAFNRFIAKGHLVPLYPKRVQNERNSGVNSLGKKGDLTAASLAADAADKNVTRKAIVELCEWGEDRNSWLVFASTVDDAIYITDLLNSFGVKTTCVHSKIPRKECDKRIAAYMVGEYRCLVNMGMLTTGFDHPPLDLIGVLRRTESPGLWVQMLGRGTRPCPETGKRDCLVLDFAGNTKRLGPINDPKIPKRKGEGGGDAPTRICEHCGTYNHAAARECCFCHEEFTFAPRIAMTASTKELIRSDEPIIEYFDVEQVYYYLHQKIGKPDSIRVSYFCIDGLSKFDEYVFLEHGGGATTKARAWWQQRFPGSFIPDTTAAALQTINQLRVPHRIKVHTNLPYPEIIGYEY